MMDINASVIPDDIFQALRRHVIPSGNAEVIYALKDGTVVGGTWVILNENIMDYYATAFRSEDRNGQPGNWIVHALLERARARGIQYFNWQSSPSRESGVYRFKARWGSMEGKHHYLTKITGDIGSFESIPLEVIKNQYQWHYLLPYEKLGKPHLIPSGHCL